MKFSKQCIACVFGVVLFSIFILPGCDSKIKAKIDYPGASYEGVNYYVFKGTLNGVANTKFKVPDFACEPNGYYVYSELPESSFAGTGLNYRVDEVSPGVLIITLLNTDNTQVDCTVKQFSRVDTYEVNDTVIAL